MRRAVVSSLLVLVAGTILAAEGSARTNGGQLRLVAAGPLTVTGTGFHPREHVHVTAASAGRTQTVRTTATRIGSFRIRFESMTVGPCDAVRVVAITRGRTVVLKRLPMRACLPERSPGSAASSTP
jgi:hypothetical protein